MKTPGRLSRTLIGLGLLIGPCLAGLGGCGGPVVTAAGESDDLVIIRDEAAARAALALRSALESPVGWLLEEHAFRGAEVSPDRFEHFTNRRHIVLVGIWGARGVERLVRGRVAGLDEDAPPRFEIVEDIWARGQVVGVVMGRDENDIIEYVMANGEAVLERFEEAAVARAAKNLCRRAGRTGIEEALAERFGWSICPPKGYDLFSADVEKGFAFFRRTRPDRTISIYWQDGEASFASEEFAIAKRTELGQRFFDGDEIEWRRELAVDAVEFGGRPAVRLSGWWANRELVGGGPFRSYCFFEPSQGRVYLVDLSLFAPALDKVPMMRNLDAVAHTFRTAWPDS
jgi:hypothetical protein